MTRFIPSEEIDQQRVRQWRFGNVQGGDGGFAVMPELTVDPIYAQPEDAAPEMADPGVQAAAEVYEPEPVEVLEPEPVEPGWSEAQVQEMLEQARQEAFAQGHAQGLEQGRMQEQQVWQQRLDDFQANQGRDIAQRLASVLKEAETAVQGLQQQLAPDLLQLACDIARQVVRQELRCNPEALEPVISEALDMMGADTKPAIVRLNPADFEQLESHLRKSIANPKVEWLADASVAPGGCLVESQGMQIDGSVERRWQRAVKALGLVSTWYEGGNGHGR